MLGNRTGEAIVQLKRGGCWRPLCGLTLALVIGLCVRGFATEGEFDDLDGSSLFDIPGRAGTREATALSYRELEALPPALSDERAALVIVKTSQGNLAKILLTAGFKKAESGESAVPVLILERFETIDSLDRRGFKARGRGVTLFDGLQYDLDSGQVVPDKMGGDIVCAPRPASEPGLKALGSCRLYTLEKPVPRRPPAAGLPSSGRAILATDFSGRFDLVADGQWSGRLDLAVDADSAVSVSFRSEKNGATYRVTGKAGEGAPQRIRFEIQFPRARQAYDGLIFSEGKNVIAGTVLMLDREYSFVAVRDGASLWRGANPHSTAPPQKNAK
jgi:hypothetical protein